jgi:hypothetical protein
MYMIVYKNLLKHKKFVWQNEKQEPEKVYRL